MAQYGYMRISAHTQNEGRQFVVMRDFGIRDDEIFFDRQSGKDFKRPAAFNEVRKAWENQEISAREAARRLGVTHKTFLEWIER